MPTTLDARRAIAAVVLGTDDKSVICVRSLGRCAADMNLARGMRGYGAFEVHYTVNGSKATSVGKKKKERKKKSEWLPKNVGY